MPKMHNISAIDSKQIPHRVSVIMPCYNGERYLEESIQCVLNQSYKDIELIIVDDGSTDNSKDIIKTYGNRLRLFEQTNKGPYPARNLGIQHSTGEFIAFLDADDYWTPDFIEKLFKALNPSNAALAYCGWQNVGIPGKTSEPYIPPDYETEDKLYAFLRAAAPWPIHAALVRASILKEAGGFDENFSTCMDYDLWLRIGANQPIIRVSEVMAFYRHHEQGQITSTQWRQAYNTWMVKKKFVKANPEMISKLPEQTLTKLIDGALLKRGYDAYWKRDTVSAQKIFRIALKTGGWTLKDLKYLLPAMLPESLYKKLIAKADNRE
jgi:glycosyltransferase involved in cell wall biosynthesis